MTWKKFIWFISFAKFTPKPMNLSGAKFSLISILKLNSSISRARKKVFPIIFFSFHIFYEKSLPSSLILLSPDTQHCKRSKKVTAAVQARKIITINVFLAHNKNVMRKNGQLVYTGSKFWLLLHLKITLLRQNDRFSDYFEVKFVKWVWIFFSVNFKCNFVAVLFRYNKTRKVNK